MSLQVGFDLCDLFRLLSLIIEDRIQLEGYLVTNPQDCGTASHHQSGDNVESDLVPESNLIPVLTVAQVGAVNQPPSY